MNTTICHFLMSVGQEADIPIELCLARAIQSPISSNFVQNINAN